MGYDRDAVQMLLYSLGPLRARRPGGLDVASGPASSSPSTSCWPRSASTRPAGSSPHARRRPRSTSTSSWPRSSRARTPSTTSSTRTRGSPRSCARRPTPGSRRRDGVDGALAGRARGRAGARRSSRFPEVVEDAVAAEETHGITAYATELATTFHGFYRDARVVDADEPERSAARLALAAATRITLANALGLLGISAPESM